MKDDYIRFRLSGTDKRMIFYRAKCLGMTVSDYLMYCVYRDLNLPSTSDPAFIKFFSQFKG